MRDDVEELDDKPLDPAVERVRRKLMRLMLISVTITIVLVLAVFGAVLYKVMKPAPHELAPVVEEKRPVPVALNDSQNYVAPLLQNKILLPEGAKIIAHSLSGNYLSLHILNNEQKEEFLLYDYTTGRYIARINLAIEP